MTDTLHDLHALHARRDEAVAAESAAAEAEAEAERLAAARSTTQTAKQVPTRPPPQLPWMGRSLPRSPG